MSQSEWGWIIGGSLFVVALIGWEQSKGSTLERGSNGAAGQSSGNRRIGWTVVDTLGSDSSGVSYYVEAYQWELPNGTIHDEEYRAARSAGAGGGTMAIASPVATFDEAQTVAQDALDRANARALNPFPQPERPPQAGDAGLPDGGNMDDFQIYEGGIDANVGGTDLIEQGGLLDGVVPI